MDQPQPSRFRIPAWMIRHWPAWLAWVALPALILAFPRGFHGNDDTLIVEYLRSGAPAPFLGDRLSPLLASLYKAGPGIPWYGLLLYATHCAIGHAGWRMLRIMGEGPGRTRRIWTVCAALVLLLVLWSFTLHLTFTIAAIAACGVGFLAFMVESRHGGLTWRAALGYGLLVVLGMQWRPDGLKGGLAGIGALGAVWLAWFLWRRRRELAVPFLAFAAPLLVSMAADRIAPPPALPPAEAAYREYNAARGAIQGFDKYKNIDQCNPEGLKAAGWTPWNYNIFLGMINFDEERFPLDRLRALEPLALPVRATSDQMAEHFFAMTDYAWPLLGLALVSSLLAGIAPGAAGRPRLRIGLGVAAAALHVAWTVAVFCGLSTVMRSPPRVTMPLILVASLACLTASWWLQGSHWLGFSLRTPPAASRQAATGARRWRMVQLAVVAAAGLGLIAAAGVAWMKTEREGFKNLFWERHGTLTEALRAHVPGVADKVIVEYTCLTGFSSGVDPLMADPFPFRAVFLEWVPPSPFFKDCLKRAGVADGAALMRAAYDRPRDMLFLIEDDYIAQFDLYAQGDLGRVVHWEQAYDIHWPSLALYRLVDGPSDRFALPGFPKGSIYRPGAKMAPMSKPAAAKPR